VPVTGDLGFGPVLAFGAKESLLQRCSRALLGDLPRKPESR
jgi:hypothetical protein